MRAEVGYHISEGAAVSLSLQNPQNHSQNDRYTGAACIFKNSSRIAIVEEALGCFLCILKDSKLPTSTHGWNTLKHNCLLSCDLLTNKMGKRLPTTWKTFVY